MYKKVSFGVIRLFLIILIEILLLLLLLFALGTLTTSGSGDYQAGDELSAFIILLSAISLAIFLLLVFVGLLVTSDFNYTSKKFDNFRINKVSDLKIYCDIDNT